jgi:hypothetical protein
MWTTTMVRTDRPVRPGRLVLPLPAAAAADDCPGHRGKKNERFYQLLLERRLRDGGVVAGHMMTANGITDITTPDEHVEIKHWRAWKAALGQLVAYQACAPRRRLTACFFGDAGAMLKERATETLRAQRIAVYELVAEGDNGSVVRVRELDPGHSGHPGDPVGASVLSVMQQQQQQQQQGGGGAEPMDVDRPQA